MSILARKIGIQINAAEELSDIILVDLDDRGISLVFVEVVATDGAITSRRMEAIYRLTDAAGFDRSDIIFVTAYEDRNSSAFKKTVPEVAWNSLVWFASEENDIIILKEDGLKLSYLKEVLAKKNTNI